MIAAQALFLLLYVVVCFWLAASMPPRTASTIRGWGDLAFCAAFVMLWPVVFAVLAIAWLARPRR